MISGAIFFAPLFYLLTWFYPDYAKFPALYFSSAGFYFLNDAIIFLYRLNARFEFLFRSFPYLCRDS